SITFDGADDGVRPPAAPGQHARFFSGPRSHQVVPGAGHNLPQEKPQVFADAVLELVQQSA
ncbi:MAG: alpha/beta hydrolase, partial [Polaromonas sp.]|uniref:alpha/beta fold hydrolase n=1 Tax=Polaromonas sp. TaxID=1869339 RepID=UPI00272F38C6